MWLRRLNEVVILQCQFDLEFDTTERCEEFRVRRLNAESEFVSVQGKRH